MPPLCDGLASLRHKVTHNRGKMARVVDIYDLLTLKLGHVCLFVKPWDFEYTYMRVVECFIISVKPVFAQAKFFA